MTVRMLETTKAKLGELAGHTRRSKSYLANDAIERYLDRELEIVAGIDRSMADMEAGKVIPHDQVMDDIDATIEAAAKARGHQ